jgi:cell division septum initiation protein DivIVA
MDILAAIHGEERKLEKQLHKLQHQLNGVRAAANALGDSTGKEIKVVKKRVLSAAGRAAIIKAAKKRWSKVRKQAKKVAG